MSRRILVADDDFDNRTIILTALRARGYQVDEAKNGLEAIELAKSKDPDLILLDLSMPKLSGWEALKRMKADPHTRHIPVFIFTAHALGGEDRRASAAGCAGYISKPCDPRKVLEMVSGLFVGAPQGKDASDIDH